MSTEYNVYNSQNQNMRTTLIGLITINHAIMILYWTASKQPNQLATGSWLRCMVGLQSVNETRNTKMIAKEREKECVGGKSEVGRERKRGIEEEREREKAGGRERERQRGGGEESE